MKRAQLIAEAVAVVCPNCGACQPEPRTGSELWTPEDFAKIENAKVPCVGCDEILHISHESKVQFPTVEANK